MDVFPLCNWWAGRVEDEIAAEGFMERFEG